MHQIRNKEVAFWLDELRFRRTQFQNTYNINAGKGTKKRFIGTNGSIAH